MLQNQLNNNILKIENLLSPFRVDTNNRIAIYTAVTNSLDKIHEPKQQDSNADYYLFTDNTKGIDTNVWNVKEINFTYRDPRRLAKIFKLFPHYLFPNYEYSIWIDANMEITNDLEELINKYLDNEKYIAFFLHGKRSCIFEEADYCIKWGNDNKDVINKQIIRYKKQGYPVNNGLIGGRFIIRKHNDVRCNELMNKWWNEIEKFSCRDQISFNYVCWELKHDYATINLNQFNNDYFIIHPHRQFVIYKDGSKLIINLKVLKSKLKHLITSSKVYPILKRCVYK